jgi:hypothetical protein
MTETQREIHNRLAGELVKTIVETPIEAGGKMTDVLVLLESVVTGVLTVAIKMGGDDSVIPIFNKNIKDRMAYIRILQMPPAGTS